MTDTDIGKTLARRLWWLTAWCVLLGAVVIALFVWVYLDEARTHSALCTFHDNLSRSVESSRQFLRERPEGIPGITPAVIRRGIKAQESTLKALAGLNCQ